ncbi:MAG: hypothetical protein WDM77_09705 [Steroidobacteraceae bacterium]
MYIARLGRQAWVPVIVFWYGGSWTEGNKDEYRFVGAALASLGYVAVLPNYRLYPQVKFPQFLDDAAQGSRLGSGPRNGIWRRPSPPRPHGSLGPVHTWRPCWP